MEDRGAAPAAVCCANEKRYVTGGLDMPWWNNWDRAVVAIVLVGWTVYLLSSIANDMRRMRQMTEEIVKYTRWRASGADRP